MSSILGVWKLAAFYVEDVATGERSETFGPNPSGIIMLHPGGRMMALITPMQRSAPKTEADQAANYQKLIAYSGHYRLEPPGRFITSVDVAWFPPWVGTDQARNYTLDGDKLEIISAPTPLPREGGADAMVIGVLSWYRESSQV